MDLGIVNQIICTCGQIVFECDVTYCSGCGDVMCKDCYTDCFTCGKMYCSNCSKNPTQCLKCDFERARPKNNEKAFIVLDSTNAIPIKNSVFMIQKTSLVNARDITLEISGKKYKYCYRQMVQNKANDKRFDYYLYFEETIDNELEKKIKEAFERYESYDDDDYYDDYGNPLIGW